MLARGGWNVTQRDLVRSLENNFPYGDFWEVGAGHIYEVSVLRPLKFTGGRRRLCSRFPWRFSRHVAAYFRLRQKPLKL